jgi:tyrosinase
VHYFLAGDMLERFSSSNDPLFFMHHGMIDLVWEMWRQMKQTRAQRERVNKFKSLKKYFCHF